MFLGIHVVRRGMLGWLSAFWLLITGLTVNQGRTSKNESCKSSGDEQRAVAVAGYDRQHVVLTVHGETMAKEGRDPDGYIFLFQTPPNLHEQHYKDRSFEMRRPQGKGIRTEWRLQRNLQKLAFRFFATKQIHFGFLRCRQRRCLSR